MHRLSPAPVLSRGLPVWVLLSGVFPLSAHAADAPLEVTASRIEVDCTRQYRDPATLPKPADNTVRLQLVVPTPAEAGLIGTSYTALKPRVELGEEVIELSGVNNSYRPGQIPVLAPYLYGAALETYCNSTAPKPRFVVDELLLPAYREEVEKQPLFTIEAVMNPEGDKPEIPAKLQEQIGLTIAEVTEKGFVLQFEAPGDIFDVQAINSSGSKVGSAIKYEGQWRLYQALNAAELEKMKDKVTRIVVDASDPSLRLEYSFKDGFQQLPVRLDVPMMPSNPMQPDLENSGSIVSVQKACVMVDMGAGPVQHNDSATTVTVALPLPAADARAIGWENLQWNKASLSDKSPLLRAEPGRMSGPIPGERPPVNADSLRGRVHGEEVLLDIPVVPRCEALSIAKLAGTVDLLLADESETFQVELKAGKWNWSDPGQSAFHLELDNERPKSLGFKVTGPLEALDFVVVDADGKPVKVSYASANSAALGANFMYNFEEPLPEGSQLVVTAHRKVSRHTVSFAAKNVPLP